MNFFVLTNPLSLRKAPGTTSRPSRTSNPRRRRAPKSKNCENAKKARRWLKKQAKVKLRDQIHQLDRQLTLLNERKMTLQQISQDAAYNIVKMYFGHIARGINPDKFPLQTQTTKQFLAATFADDLKSPDFTGLDQFIAQWQLFSEYHAAVECQVSQIDVYPLYEEKFANEMDEQEEKSVNVVKASGSTTLQISRTSIERIFPHILPDETLVQRLIGKKYSLSYTLFAYVDSTSGRVLQIESRVDLTSALLDLLQDPFVTVKMVESTRMSKHGTLLLTQAVGEEYNMNGNGPL